MNAAGALIALSGNIGCGKSVVAHFLRQLGYSVYDCDSNAKWLMNHDPVLKSNLATLLGTQAYDSEGRLNTAWLRDRLFANTALRAQVNALVHPAVVNHLLDWHAQRGGLCFFETALLAESGLNQHASQIWDVQAPEPLRVRRLMARNNITAEQALERIHAQRKYVPHSSDHYFVIINDGVHPIIPQVFDLLECAQNLI